MAALDGEAGSALGLLPSFTQAKPAPARCIPATAMKHYLAVLIPNADGGWRAHLPDFPGCRAEAQTVEAAVDASGRAATEQARWLRAQGVSLPTPQTYEEVRHFGNGWAAERNIDWSKAVISLVPLSSNVD
jgi:predicted RNase H-like HicB family nuclease